MSANNSKKGLVYDSGTCRCCGASKKCRLLNMEYEHLNKKEIYLDMIVECFGLVLSNLDGEPSDRLICAMCVGRLREACSFRRQVLECEERLLQSSMHVHDDLLFGPAPIDFKTEIIKEEIPDDTMNSDDENNDDVMEIIGTANDTVQVSEVKYTEDLSSNKSIEKNNEDRLQKDLLLKIQGMKKRLKMIQSAKEQKTKKPKKQPLPSPPVEKFVDEESIAFQNMLILIENSYVYPFQTAYSSFHCAYCGGVFPSPGPLRAHSLGHDPRRYRHVAAARPTYLDVRRTDCRLCDERPEDVRELQLHLATAHRLPVRRRMNVLMFRLTDGPLSCIECDASFMFFHALKRHMAVHFGNFVCDVCGEHYFDKNGLEQHCRNTHRSDVKYTCHECGKLFKRQQALSMHLSCVHKKEPAFQCIKCEVSLYSAQERHKHMRDAHGVARRHACEKCGKAYNSRGNLLEHNRTVHLRVYKHKCALCHRGFSHQHRLSEHVMSMHRTESQYFCDICGNSYPRLHFLKLHIQSHANENTS